LARNSIKKTVTNQVKHFFGPNYSLPQSENRNSKHMNEFLFIALDQDSILTIF